jgi:hypothetical protein
MQLVVSLPYPTTRRPSRGGFLPLWTSSLSRGRPAGSSRGTGEELTVRTEVFGPAAPITPGVIGTDTRLPHLPTRPLGMGPLVTFTSSAIGVHCERLCDRSRRLVRWFALCVALAAVFPAFAQSPQGYAPAREGNIYDHKAHQPTAGDVCTEAAAASINCQSEASRSQVDEEVQKLLRETDIGAQSARQQLDNPNGRSSWPSPTKTNGADADRAMDRP